jgi:hypothetical protein
MGDVQYSDIDQREPDRLAYFPYVRSYIITYRHETQRSSSELKHHEPG